MSNAAAIVAALEAAILKNPLTLSATADGQTITFASLADRDRTHAYWKNRAAVESGSRPRMFRMGLGGPTQ
jgi:hypothetical protein